MKQVFWKNQYVRTWKIACFAVFALGPPCFVGSLCAQDGGQAIIPSLINYQGYIEDSGGNPIENPVSVTFRIWDAESGGSCVWTESQLVDPEGGIFDVLLGSEGTPLDDS